MCKLCVGCQGGDTSNQAPELLAAVLLPAGDTGAAARGQPECGGRWPGTGGGCMLGAASRPD